MNGRDIVKELMGNECQVGKPEPPAPVKHTCKQCRWNYEACRYGSPCANCEDKKNWEPVPKPEPPTPDISKGVWFQSEGSDKWCKGRFVGQVSAVMADGKMFVTVEHNRQLADEYEDVVRWLDKWSRTHNKQGLRSISELNLIIKEANRQCEGDVK